MHEAFANNRRSGPVKRRLLAFVAAILALAACSQPLHRAARTSAPRPTPSGGTFPHMIFPGHRVVAYYGEADVPAMGVLGTAPPQQILPKLLRQARAYAPYGEPVIAGFELIAVVAQRAPGNADAYSAPIDGGTAQRYLNEIRKVHGLLILDVQPGRAAFLPYVKRYEQFLRQPDVSLAMDSEWSMGPQEVPGEVIGSTNAATVNAVSAYLSALTSHYHLPQKLLIVHQFTSDMIERRHEVAMRPGLAIVFHVDGFGSRAGKLNKYGLLSRDRHGAFIGLKLFYQQDVDMFSAAELMRLSPRPDLVTYQ